MKKGKEAFFVGVENTVDIRRHVLESMKHCIGSLQGYERLKSIREDKINIISKLRGKLREISGLFNDMKEILPKTDLKIKKPKEIKRVDVEKPKAEKPKITELQKLERELNEIEGKLSTLA